MCTYQALEWKLSDQELSGLLVSPDLSESDSTRLITVRLLDTTGRWCALASGFGSKLFAGGLATSGLTGGLLGASHFGC